MAKKIGKCTRLVAWTRAVLLLYMYVKIHALYSFFLAELKELVEDLEPCAAQWRMLGIMLKIRPADLDAIVQQIKPVDKCLMEVLRVWLQTEHSPHTLEQLLKALRTKAMGPEEVLAQEIEKNKGTGIDWLYHLNLIYISHLAQLSLQGSQRTMIYTHCWTY